MSAARAARIGVVIPVLNEETAIPRVLQALPRAILSDVVVVDNGSTDRTADAARNEGARVVLESRRGYGAACLAGIAALPDADIIVFLDGDFSDHPEELPALVEPIAAGRADLVIGSRALGRREPGAILPQARFGNWLATTLIRSIWGTRYTDLGPFRAIRASNLQALGMTDHGFGWTVEMQIRAARAGLRIEEVPVSYRRRIGTSKISGTVRGTIMAGSKILWTIFRHALAARRIRPAPGTVG